MTDAHCPECHFIVFADSDDYGNCINCGTDFSADDEPVQGRCYRCVIDAAPSDAADPDIPPDADGYWHVGGFGEDGEFGDDFEE